MELTKIHREHLLNCLATAENELSRTDAIINREKNKAEDAQDRDLLQYQDIERFLLKQEIEIIKKSITDNEIDY